MTTSTSTIYVARWRTPELVERSPGTATARCRIYRSGVQITPTSGTLTVSNPSGVAFVDALAATIDTDGTATYAVPDTSGESLSDGWRFVWALAMPDGETHTFSVDGSLVRQRLHPVISEIDIFGRLKALDPSGRAPIATRVDYADKLDEAWAEIQNWLISKDDRPWLVLSPVALRQMHLELTLSYIFAELALRGSPQFMESARERRLAYTSARSEVTLRYDKDDDGVIDDTDRRRGVGSRGVLWTNGRGW